MLIRIDFVSWKDKIEKDRVSSTDRNIHKEHEYFQTVKTFISIYMRGWMYFLHRFFLYRSVLVQDHIWAVIPVLSIYSG